MHNFEKLGIPDILIESLIKMNFINPTPIQEKAIPPAMEGNDILGTAQTGTGKTAAFAIPLVKHLLTNDDSVALVLLPTRELADQVLGAIKNILGNIHINSALLIGGDSMMKQMKDLRKKPRLIVGTPGRINDHLRRKTLNLSKTDFLVLDETDRMLDMGFEIQLEEIVKFLPKKRQTLMFSATLPKKIISLSKKYLNNPIRIAIGATNEVAKNVQQKNISTNDANKYSELLYQIEQHPGSVLVFVKTKFGTERLAKKLKAEGLTSDVIHGDLRQRQRENAIARFRKQNFRILVATDIASRGLDISHIESVINYDLPQSPEDYIHRIGRTGRADATGVAINLLTPKDNKLWREIQKMFANKQTDMSENDDKPVKKRTSKKSSNQEQDENLSRPTVKKKSYFAGKKYRSHKPKFADKNSKHSPSFPHFNKGPKKSKSFKSV